MTLAAATMVVVAAARGESAQPSSALDEVVVTATRRSESIQTVGLSITAFDQAQLESKGVVSFVDYATAVPNLAFGAFASDGALGSRGIALRGVQGRGTTGMYIDDTPVIDSLDPRVIDIDRIEVLRGPQGTLYGARSMGGTVRLITNQPDLKQFFGNVHAGISSTQWDSPNYILDGAVNLPLSDDRLALRLSAFEQYDEGIFDKGFGPRSAPPTSIRKNVDNANTYGGQVALRFEPIEGLSLTPRVMYQHTKLDGFPYADGNAGNFLQRQVFDIAEGGTDKWTLSSLTINYQTNFGTFTSSSSYFDREIFEQEDASDALQLDFGFPTLLKAPTTRDTALKRFAQELRFASAFAGPFQLVSGLFWSDSKVPRDYEWGAVGLGAAIGVPSDNALTFIDERKTTELAGYGEASYKVLPKLKATLGLRYFENTATFMQHVDGIFFGGPSTTIVPKTTEHGVTPKYLLEYQATDQALLYASAAKGFRIGGNNIALPSICDADLAAINLTRADVGTFKSDSVWNYEVGVKSTLADRRMTVNAAAFRIDWDKIQQSVSLPTCGYGFTGNAGKARSQGFELEINARPLEELTLGANVGYTDAKITQAAPNSPQAVGSRVYQVPDWNGSFNAEYVRPIFSDKSGFVRGDYSYTGGSLSANNDQITPRLRPAYRLLDLRFGIRKGGYEVALFAKNLTNEHANLSDVVQIGQEYPGRPRIVVNRPRTIGIDVRAKF